MSRVLIDGYSKTLINEILRRYCRLINIITHCIMASWGSLHQNINRSFSWPYLDMIFKSDAIAKLKRPTYRPAQSRKRRLMTDAWRLTTFNCFSLQIFWHLKTFTDFWNLRFSKSIPRAGKRSAAAMALYHRWINSPGMDQHFSSRRRRTTVSAQLAVSFLKFVILLGRSWCSSTTTTSSRTPCCSDLEIV